MIHPSLPLRGRALVCVNVLMRMQTQIGMGSHPSREITDRAYVIAFGWVRCVGSFLRFMRRRNQGLWLVSDRWAPLRFGFRHCRGKRVTTAPFSVRLSLACLLAQWYGP